MRALFLFLTTVALSTSLWTNRLHAEQTPESPSPFPILFEGLESADAVLKESAAKTMFKELSTQIEASDKNYLKKIATGIVSDKIDEHASALSEWRSAYSTTKKYNQKPLADLQIQLASTDATIRKNAQISFVLLLNTVIENSAIEKLIDDLASPETAVSKGAMEKLKAFGEEAAFTLVNALEDDRLQVRRLALETLKSLGSKAKSVADQLAFLLDNDDKTVRRSSAAVLENLGPDAAEATDQLVKYLEHDEKSVRHLAANILKKIGPAAAESGTSALIELLTHSDPTHPNDRQVRTLATEVLLTFGDAAAKDGLEPLIDILKETDSDDDARSRAVQILVMLNGAAKPALPELKRLATEGSDTFKKCVSDAIPKIEAAPTVVPVQEKNP